MSYERRTCRSECIATPSEHVGYMTNQPHVLVKGRAHMSQVVCARPECRRRAERQIRDFTSEPAVFMEFAS